MRGNRRILISYSWVPVRSSRVRGASRVIREITGISHEESWSSGRCGWERWTYLYIRLIICKYIKIQQIITSNPTLPSPYQLCIGSYQTHTSLDNLQITLLTIHGLWSLWNIRRDHIYATLVTFSLIELPRIAECHTVEVPLVWMSPWYWQVMLAIELQFLLDDTKWLLAHLTLYSPIQYIIRYWFYRIWELTRRDDFLYSRERSLVVWPVKYSFLYSFSFR